MAVDLELMKSHLNVTVDDDDALIAQQLAAAKKHIERQLGFALDDAEKFPDGAAADLDQAVMQLAAHWYENREATITGTIIAAIPLGVRDIVNEHRNYSFGGGA